MILTAVGAGCFAWLDGMLALTVLVPLSLLTVRSGRTPWKDAESAAAAAWLLWAVPAFSDVFLHPHAFLALFATGSLLAATWFLRLRAEGFGLARRPTLATLGFAPWALLLGLALLATDLDFRARLILSEPALRAYATDFTPGMRGSYHQALGRVGLFPIRKAFERDGCVLLATGSFDRVDYGLAYIPQGSPPRWAAHWNWRHVQGPWWRFVLED